MEIWTFLYTGCIIILMWMLLFWLIYCIFKNPAIVDLGWSLGMGVLALCYFVLSQNLKVMNYLVVILTLIWSTRLSILIGYRIFTKLKDGRYHTLDQKWAKHRTFKYFLFFLFQGICALIFTLPIVFVATNALNLWSLFGIAIMAIAIFGESLSDLQLLQFIKNKDNQGKVCKKGLWKYSRHPNYFFEWCFWVGAFLSAIATHMGWVSVISPLAMLLTLLFFSGIPPSEFQAIKTKGDAYKQYQRETSAFIPWRNSK